MSHAKRLAAIEAQLTDTIGARADAMKVLSKLLESKAERFAAENLSGIDLGSLAPVDVLALAFAGHHTNEMRDRSTSLSATPGPVGKLFVSA